MKIQLLVLHRAERYPGEHSPEVVAVVDQVTLEENPGWWPEQVKKVKAEYDDPQVVAWAQVAVELPDKELLTALYPDMPVVNAEVTPAPGPSL